MASGDEVRRLGRSSGYVPDHARALPSEPLEAVSEAEQERQTEAAARAVLDAKIQRRAATRSELERERQWLESRLRYVGREIRRLARVT